MRWIAIVAVVVAGLVISGALGGADAQTSTTPAPPASSTRTISVGGSADRPLAQGSDRATATAAYEAAIAGAIDSARGKADFIANKLGTTVADARNVTEGGGFVDCGEDTEYTGVEPDMTGAGSSGAGGVPVASSAPASRAAPKPKRKRHRKRKRHAHKSAAASCTVSASVAVTYATGG